VDCEVAWGEWEQCRNNERVRKQYVSVHQAGVGAACPELQTEREGKLKFSLSQTYRAD